MKEDTNFYIPPVLEKNWLRGCNLLYPFSDVLNIKEGLKRLGPFINNMHGNKYKCNPKKN